MSSEAFQTVIQKHKLEFGVKHDCETPTIPLRSSLANRQDVIALVHLLKHMKISPDAINRKAWEWVYIIQALSERGMLSPGKRGLGFAVGSEPLVSFFASNDVTITATDLDLSNEQTQYWSSTNQHVKELSQLLIPEICDIKMFKRNVSFAPVDMNCIPNTLKGFDFCWSSCAFEHLGSEKNGEAFILNTLNTLKPGGVSVHTTEFNLTTDKSYQLQGDNPYTTVFGKSFFEGLYNKIVETGGCFAPLDFRLGNHPDEDYIYNWEGTRNHFKLVLGEVIATSIGIIIIKGRKN